MGQARWQYRRQTAGAAPMAALGDGLLAESGGVDADESSLEAARWETPSEQENLVPLRAFTLRVIRMGVNGPAPCTAQIWFPVLSHSPPGSATECESPDRESVRDSNSPRGNSKA